MSDDLNPDARQLVDLAREARTPGEHDKLRIAERLAIPLAAGVIAGSAAGAAKAATVSAATANSATGAALAGAAATKAAGAGLLTGIGVKIAAAVAVVAAGTAILVSNLDSQTAAPVTAPVVAPASSPEPVKPPAAAIPGPQAPEPTVEAPKATPVNPPLVHSTTPAHELAQEATLLHEAQAAWRAGQSARALQLANQHAQRFPRSQLADERDVLRVLSLCRLGQVQSAKQIGTRLLRKAKAPWYQSVADSCAAD